VIELIRVIEDQTALYSYRVTQDEKQALQLESLLEYTKPKAISAQWHRLIATPFRYTPPLKNGRFRHPFGKNVFYGSVAEETSLYEHAYHFMKERIHLTVPQETGSRTIFVVNANNASAIHITQDKNSKTIMDRKNYTASHEFISNHPQIHFILYPSCRDPKARDNAAILDIHLLGKNPHWESSIKFFYDNRQKIITWLDYQLSIEWEQVA
jgi:hypothetical protein